METKKWIHYGWQTVLLCMVVSVSQPVFAASTPPSSTNKDNARKPKTAKSQPGSGAAPSKSMSSSRQATTRAHTPPKEPTIHKKDKLTSTTAKEVRARIPEKCCAPTIGREQKTHSERGTAQQKKVLKEEQSAQRTLPRASPQTAEKRRPKGAEQAKDTIIRAQRSNRRYVTVLKETTRHRMEKVVIEIPRDRMAMREQQRQVIKPKVEQKSRLLTKLPERAPTQSVPKTRSLLTAVAVTKSPLPAVAELTQPQSIAPQSVTMPPGAPATPTPALSSVAPPVANAAPQQDKPQIATPAASSTASQDAPRTVAATPPQPTTLALIDSSTSKTVATKEEHSAKEWSGYSPQKAPFVATVNDEPLGHRVNSLFVLPGDEIFVAVADAQKRAEYTVRGTLGPERLLASRRWYWTAPSATGVYQLKITNTRTNSAITLNVFVMVPLNRIDEDGYLNGYRIGTYPIEPLRQLAMYNRPRGLIEITPENENMLVSPHFRLRQFLCKQDGGYPKYVILDARLLTTLELLLEMVNTRGYRARTFSIMSGYRTPYYNRAIGNRTTYSRHLWGDAADIYIDEEPRDGKMDDLNEDGVIDAHDADVIYQLIESAAEPRIQKIMLGGLARYRETSSHGPFIHVDARGSYTRWGLKTLTKGGTTRTEANFPANENAPVPSYWKSGTADDDLR